jgi:hypothetical protein
MTWTARQFPFKTMGVKVREQNLGPASQTCYTDGTCVTQWIVSPQDMCTISVSQIAWWVNYVNSGTNYAAWDIAGVCWKVSGVTNSWPSAINGWVCPPGNGTGIINSIWTTVLSDVIAAYPNNPGPWNQCTPLSTLINN